jgi:hypothetical protein
MASARKKEPPLAPVKAHRFIAGTIRAENLEPGVQPASPTRLLPDDFLNRGHSLVTVGAFRLGS